MHRDRSTPELNNIIFIAFVSFILLIISCDSDNETAYSPEYNSGAIRLKLVWDHDSHQQLGQYSPSGDVCEDYAIDTINVTVTDSSDTTVALKSFPCTEHAGTIDQVPEGSDMTLSIAGVVAGNADWQSQATGISVIGDQNTDIGTLVMKYLGDDETPPTIVSYYPASNATDVPLNSTIEAKFSEDVVSASVKSAIALVGNATVPGEITYDASNMAAYFSPESDLLQDTDYSITVTADIEDLAGNKMAVPFTWSFATGIEVDTAPPSIPNLLDVTTVSHSQIDLSWSTSTDNVGVQAYKVFRNDAYAKSVSTTWATDTDLYPDTEYCYTISAIDAAENESAKSNEMCVTTPSSPPPSIPALISPQNGEVLDNNCDDFSDEIQWNFDWSDAANATKYNIYVVHPGFNPIIDTEVNTSNYESSVGGYIRTEDRLGWTWKVRAGNDYGQWSGWSPVRTFDVEPLNTDCPN